MQIIGIGKKRYIAGAHWQTVEGGSSKPKKMLSEARKLNSMIGGSNNAVFLGRRQYALVSVPSKKKLQILPSLASSIRESGIDNALLKFCLSEQGNLWYVLAISDGLILPEGDSVFEDEDSIDDHISEITATYEFDIVQSYEDAADAFEFLENNVVAHLKIRTLYGKPLGLQLGVATLVLCLGIGGYQGFRYYQKIANNKAEALRFAEQAAMKSQKIEAINGQLDVYFPPLYKELPVAQEVIETCRENVSSLPINSNGWELSGYVCTTGSYFPKWKYLDGVSFLKLPIYSKPNITVPKEPVPTPQVVEHEYGKLGEVELLSKEEAFLRMSEWARLSRGNIAITWEQPARKIVGKDAYFEGVEIVSPFTKGRWQMSIEETTYLTDLPMNTQGVPGLVLNQIAKTDNFIIQGEIYVQSY